jgi:microcystin-dependent protein
MKYFKWLVSTRRLALAGSLAALCNASAWACSESGSVYVGTVCFTAANYCPDGYLVANGSVQSITQYQALYSLVGTAYGGDGRTTFGLPDLRGRAAIGLGQGPGLTNVQYGEKRGAENVTLSAAQVPVQQHTHPATFTGTGGGSGTPAQASGNVSLPVVVNIPRQDISVSGNLKIANSTATGAQAVSANAVLAKGGGQASIYAPASTTADTNIGPSQTLTGSLAASTVNATAAGNVTLPVTGGGGGITGGTVAVGSNQVVPAAIPVSLIPPEQALNACIAVYGLYPPRP